MAKLLVAAIAFALLPSAHGARHFTGDRSPVMPAHLLAMSQNCKCEFKGECSCEGSVAFMNCIEAACTSGMCDCEKDNNPHHFLMACQEMDKTCPSTGLVCSDTAATCIHHGNATVQPAAEERAPPSAPVAETKAKAAPPVAQSEALPQVFPVPTASRCVVIICCTYMLVYLALAICRTYLEFQGVEGGAIERALRAAAQTVGYGPMLCVLFIACRLRVEFLSGGKGQPQIWVQNCMYATTFAVLASTLLVLLIPLVTGKPLLMKPGTNDLAKPEGGGIVVTLLSCVRYLIMLGLYGGIAGVIYGITTYTPAGESDFTKLPAPAPAVMCTMILTTIFFLMQLVVAGARSYTEFAGKETIRLQNVMNAASDTVSFAPMLSILFLAARMRALQHGGQPQEWAQHCMFSATLALSVTAMLAILVPLVIGGEMETDPRTRQPTFKVQNKMLGALMIGLRYITFFAMYAGCIGVMASIYVFQHPDGKEHTLPVSPTVNCVGSLCSYYFFVYFILSLLTTITELSGGAYKMEEYRLFGAVDSAKVAVAFAPMLAILFVTTRMYALQLTDKKGAPPAWVQDGMYMATWSVHISVWMCLLTGLVTESAKDDEKCHSGDDPSAGVPHPKFSNKYVAGFLTVVRYTAMALLYLGIACVIIGLFTMTKETANGEGSIPVVTDALNQTPVGHAPPAPAV